MWTLHIRWLIKTQSHTCWLASHLPAGFWLAGCQKVARHLQRWSPAPWGCRWYQELGLRWSSDCYRLCCASARRWVELSGQSCSKPGSPWFARWVPQAAPTGPALCWHSACVLGHAEVARRGPVRLCVFPRGHWEARGQCCWQPWHETHTQSRG